MQEKGLGEVLVVEDAAQGLPRCSPQRQPFRVLLVCTDGPPSLLWMSVALCGREAGSSQSSPETPLLKGRRLWVWARQPRPPGNHPLCGGLIGPLRISGGS